MTKTIKLPYKLLIYDIETGLLLAWMFALGEQAVRHNQLLECADMFSILTVSYKWYGDQEVHVLEGDNCVEEFDKVARQADVIIGKNNYRFDDKRLNTERVIKGLNPFPEWLFRSDDLESQLRKYFAFPSYSLDALSKYFGHGGKDKMDFEDWKDIAKYKILDKIYRTSTEYDAAIHLESVSQVLFKTNSLIIRKKGLSAINKMMKYNKKDVLDTEAILKKVLKYIKLKKNASTIKEVLGCITCGSPNISATDKVITAGQTKYQEFYCYEHEGYAGRSTWYYKGQSHSKTYRRMQ